MRLAVPVWEGRVSPVFDVARDVLIVDSGASASQRTVQALDDLGMARRADALEARGVRVLICGAISAPLEALLTARGMVVISGICGPIEAVLQAYAAGALERDWSLHAPGCRGRHGGQRGRMPGRHRHGPQGRCSSAGGQSRYKKGTEP